MAGLSEPAFEKLVKLLQMTVSATDNEKLSAIKMANVLLKAADYNWEDLLRGKIVTFPADTPNLTQPKSANNSTLYRGPEIKDFFNILLNDPEIATSDFMPFVTSVYEQWKLSGGLSEKQYNVIKRSAQLSAQHVFHRRRY